MPRPTPLNSFEKSFQFLVATWVDEQIAATLQGMATGASLHKPDVTQIAMDCAINVSRIRALEDVKTQMIEIEKQLMGQ